MSLLGEKTLADQIIDLGLRLRAGTLHRRKVSWTPYAAPHAQSVPGARLTFPDFGEDYHLLVLSKRRSTQIALIRLWEAWVRSLLTRNDVKQLDELYRQIPSTTWIAINRLGARRDEVTLEGAELQKFLDAHGKLVDLIERMGKVLG